MNNLLAISPIDGRYANKCPELQEIFSEYGLIKRRILVECAWLEALCDAKEIKECKALSAKERKLLRAIGSDIEPEDAAVLSGGTIGTHLQMGIGDGIIPSILDASVIDEIALVGDDEALATARRMAAEEGLLTGISGGTNVAVALRLAARLGEGHRVVTVLPDTGERYFSTPLFTG